MTLETPHGWTLPLTLTVTCKGKISNCMFHEKYLKAFPFLIPGEDSLKVSLPLDWLNAIFTDGFSIVWFCVLFFFVWLVVVVLIFF